MKESISTIMPVHNGEQYIAEAIGSVLNQTRLPHELIIINDGSTDQTVDVVNALINDVNTAVNIRLFSQKKSGIGSAMKKGVHLSGCPFLAFLDSDDLWEAHKLERQMAYFKIDPRADFVVGMVKQFLSPELCATERAKIQCDTRKLNGLVSGAMCLRKSRYYELGEWGEDPSLPPFIDWFSRVSLGGAMYHVLDDVVLHRRLHKNNFSRHKRATLNKGFLTVLDARVKFKRIS